MKRWRGRESRRRERVANACDSFVDLTPASELPAALVRQRWSALLPGQNIPLIWEASYGDREEDDFC